MLERLYDLGPAQPVIMTTGPRATAPSRRLSSKQRALALTLAAVGGVGGYILLSGQGTAMVGGMMALGAGLKAKGRHLLLGAAGAGLVGLGALYRTRRKLGALLGGYGRGGGFVRKTKAEKKHEKYLKTKEVRKRSTMAARVSGDISPGNACPLICHHSSRRGRRSGGMRTSGRRRCSGVRRRTCSSGRRGHGSSRRAMPASKPPMTWMPSDHW
jgi:hypothetical protein